MSRALRFMRKLHGAKSAAIIIHEWYNRQIDDDTTMTKTFLLRMFLLYYPLATDFKFLLFSSYS
jgi:hypothetical protein